jgi:hypothetical protein
MNQPTIKLRGDVDNQSSVRKYGTKNFGGVTAENVAEIGADNGAQRYHDEVHPESSQRAGRSYQPGSVPKLNQAVMANSIAVQSYLSIEEAEENREMIADV